jgi:hypothetical protein
MSARELGLLEQASAAFLASDVAWFMLASLPVAYAGWLALGPCLARAYAAGVR